MKTRDTRTDSGQYYPGGNVIPRQPVRPGGGSDADAVHYYAETKTDDQKAQARQNIDALGSDDSIPQSQVTGLADALEAKRDKTDEACYDLSFTYPDYSYTGVDFDYSVSGSTVDELRTWGCLLTWLKSTEDYVETDGWYSPNGPELRSTDRNLTRIEYDAIWVDIDEVRHEAHVIATRNVVTNNSHRLARRDATAASALAKFDADGNLVADDSGKGLSTNDYTDADKAEVAKVKDKRDLTDYAVKLTTGNFGIAKWFYTNGTNFIWNADTNRWEDEEVSSHYVVGEYANGVWHFVSTFPSREWDGFESKEDEELGHKFVAVFADSIAKKSETLAPGLSAQGVPTDANVQELFSESNTSLKGVIAAKSIPTYSSSATYEVGEIVLHGGVTYKCAVNITTAEAWTSAHWTEATGAEIAARLKGFKADGSATDAFATDLFGKQVAKAAIVKECLYDEYTVPTTGDDAYNLHANASNLLVFNSSQTSYTFDLSAHLPQKVNGKLMDFFIELNTDAPVTVSTNAADTAKIRGDSPSVSEAGNYWITFSTKADGTIYIRNIKMEAPQS